MHAHEHKAAVEDALGLGKAAHSPFPTTLYREPKRDDQGHFILPFITKTVNTPEDMKDVDHDLWRESPAAWDKGYKKHKPAAVAAVDQEALEALEETKQALADENAELKRQLAEARASTARASDVRYVAPLGPKATDADVARMARDEQDALEDHNRQLRRNLAETRAEPGSTTAAAHRTLAPGPAPVGTATTAPGDPGEPEDTGPETQRIIGKDHAAGKAKADAQEKSDATLKANTTADAKRSRTAEPDAKAPHARGKASSAKK